MGKYFSATQIRCGKLIFLVELKTGRFRLGCGSEGAGLGLSIVKTAVEAMGDAVTADSEPGGGTKITLSLKVE